MKIGTVTLALLLAAPLVAQADTKGTQTRIHGRAVTVITETMTKAPAEVESEFERAVDQRGWHDDIYRSVEGDKAFLIFSERDADACTLTEVKVTLWKAVVEKGKTVTEARIYRLRPAEVNSFLDNELRNLAVEFKASPIKAS